METLTRGRFQGVWNIIRFNWHFYFLSALLLLSCFFIQFKTEGTLDYLLQLFMLAMFTLILVSLVVSFYVYDCSDLYRLHWLNNLNLKPGAVVLNIHAGFDETSLLIQHKFPQAALHVFDFYDERTHTEVSIKRARKAYPAFPGTVAFQIPDLPLPAAFADVIFVIMAAHEVRNRDERISLLSALNTTLKPGGKVIVVEHIRDLSNFLAYNIGFFHFFPRKEWLRNFSKAGLQMQREIKITPFISVFILV